MKISKTRRRQIARETVAFWGRVGLGSNDEKYYRQAERVAKKAARKAVMEWANKE